MSIQGQDPDLSLYSNAIKQAESLYPISSTTIETIENRTKKIGLDTIRAFDPTSSSPEAKKLAESLKNKMSVTTEKEFTVLLKAANDFLLILDEVQPFHIEPPPPLTLAANAPTNAPYTILEHSLRSKSDVHRMALAFPKTPIRDLVALKPERLVLHEMAARLVLEVSLTESDMDQEIARLSHAMTQEFLDQNPDFASQLLEERSKLEETILQYLDDKPIAIASNIKQLVDQLKANMELDSEKKLAIAHYASDLAYRDHLQRILQKYPIFESSALKGYSHLPAQVSQDRRLIMINGGIASGKGETEKQIQQKIEADGIPWSSVAKLNTDSFKRTLLDPSSIEKEHVYYYGGLVHDEAAMIRNRIFSEFQRKLKDNTAPHMYFDQVWPQADILTLGGKSSRGLDLYLVQIPVEQSVHMAYQRGKMIGRFETTKGLLNSHKQVALQFQENIKKATDAGARNIRVHFMANIAKGVVEKAATFDFQKKAHDLPVEGKKHLVSFYKKTMLNTDAHTMEELYAASVDEEKHADQMINELKTL